MVSSFLFHVEFLVTDVIVSRQYFHVSMFVNRAVTTDFMGNMSIKTRYLRLAVESYVDTILFGIFMVDDGHAIKVFHCIGEFFGTQIINYIYKEYLINLGLHDRV